MTITNYLIFSLINYKKITKGVYPKLILDYQAWKIHKKNKLLDLLVFFVNV